jgi:transcriptional regulator with XRE-family HTH domain
MSSEEIFINGELMRLSRESRGWLLNDMATRACMSVKQIRQIEEGGISAFYSMAVKATAAKKICALLELPVDQVFAKNVASGQAEAVINLDVSSEDLVVAQESVHTKPDISEPTLVPIKTGTEASKSKASLRVLAGLFVAALAVTAYMQPQDEPAAEPAPPLQVVPTEMSDPASAASAADATISVQDAMVAPVSAVAASQAQ